MIGGNPFICKDEEWKEKRAEISPALTALKVFIVWNFFKKEKEKFNGHNLFLF